MQFRLGLAFKLPVKEQNREQLKRHVNLGSSFLQHSFGAVLPHFKKKNYHKGIKL